MFWHVKRGHFVDFALDFIGSLPWQPTPRTKPTSSLRADNQDGHLVVNRLTACGNICCFGRQIYFCCESVFQSCSVAFYLTRFDDISLQLTENEVGRGGLDAKAAASRPQRNCRRPGPKGTTKKPNRIPPSSPVSSVKKTKNNKNCWRCCDRKCCKFNKQRHYRAHHHDILLSFLRR